MAPTPLSFDDDRPYASDGRTNERRSTRSSSGNGGERLGLIITGVTSVLGVIFAGVSTSDFINHLDRQVHSIHCSFVPGAGAELGESGCRTVMLSPYSSLFRESMWGGLPISLLAVAVFAYLVMRTGQLLLSRNVTKRDTLFLVAATALPLLMSAIYAIIAITKIGAVCKLCIGVYLSSVGVFVGAVLAHMRAPPSDTRESPVPLYARWFGEGVLYVAVLALFYVFFAPSAAKSEGGCGTLAKKDDPAGVFIPLGESPGGVPSIAVLDPLCPACKAFDERLRSSDLYKKMSLNAVLFPLDATCNWMVKASIHAGACAVSEAMLCDKTNAGAVLDYAFANQAELREEAKLDDGKLRKRLEAKFPKLKGCLGSPNVKNKLNKSLRFAVDNALPVLTPQLFVGDKRVCDEDTDLGLEFTVSQMLSDADHAAKRR